MTASSEPVGSGSSSQPGGNGSSNSAVKPGYLTTEFWATLATLLMPLATLVFHQDFSDQVQAIAAAAAAIATAVYTLSRALTKSSQSRSVVAAAASGTSTLVQGSSIQGSSERAAGSAEGLQTLPLSPGVQTAAAQLAVQLRRENGAHGPDGQPTVTVIAV